MSRVEKRCTVELGGQRPDHDVVNAVLVERGDELASKSIGVVRPGAAPGSFAMSRWKLLQRSCPRVAAASRETREPRRDPIMRCRSSNGGRSPQPTRFASM